MGEPRAAAAIAAYGSALPPDACVGAILGGDEPSYALFGPNLRHRLLYLTTNTDPVRQPCSTGSSTL